MNDPTQLTDNEKIIDLLAKQERHQKFFSTVLSVYLILQVIVVFGFIAGYLISKMPHH